MAATWCCRRDPSQLTCHAAHTIFDMFRRFSQFMSIAVFEHKQTWSHCVAALPCMRPFLSLQVVSVDELGQGIRDFNKGALRLVAYRAVFGISQDHCYAL